jgi:hypothetical protein
MLVSDRVHSLMYVIAYWRRPRPHNGPYALQDLRAAFAGKPVQLLIGLNSATSPAAVAEVYKLPNVSARYRTRRFHAKIFLFDDAALLGSANLTTAGLLLNREAVICLDQRADTACYLLQYQRAVLLPAVGTADTGVPVVGVFKIKRLALISGHGRGGSSPGDEPKVPSHLMTDVTSPRSHTVN